MVTTIATLDDWRGIFMIAVVVLVILNIHLGITYTTMLLPFRGIIPGLYGIDVVIALSAIIILFERYWESIGGFVLFVFVFGLIWLLT